MQAEAWATVGVGLTTLGGITVAWMTQRAQSRRVEGKVDQAARTAAAAVENTNAVSNGFATKTTDGIGQLLAGQARVEGHLERLTEAHGRTVSRLDHTIERLDRHLDPPPHVHTDGTGSV